MSENTGQGSSGSWRDDDVDSTKRKLKEDVHILLVNSRAFERRQRDHVHYQPVGVRAARRQRGMAKKHTGLKPMRFKSLHHHSTYSFLDGFQLPEAHVRRAAEINMDTIAHTEHGNIFSHVKLEGAAEKAGIKPVFGCEFYMGWTDEKRRTQRKNHLTVLAKNAKGYENLLELVTRSWAEGFHYEPTVDWRWLEQHKEGLVILSGCQGSALFTAMVGGKHVPEDEAGYRRGLRVARWFADRFEDFYIEVQAFPELDKTRRANPLLARVAAAVHRPLVATMDCHYTAPEEAEVQKVLHNVRPGEKRTLEEMVQDWGYDVPLCPPATDKAIYRRLKATGLTKEQAVEAIVSTEEIAQECNVQLPKLPTVQFPLPEGYDIPEDLWRDWLREGWRYRGCHELPRQEMDRYRAQLKKEMEVIEAKGYVNYFLIVSDSIKFAKDQQIPVGAARGSAAASLACYLLRITEVDPMEYDNLVFERFIDWSREDMPDVDIDFATYGRPIVRQYLLDKYGEGCVNNVGTFTMYKSKNALDDAARVHRVPESEVSKLKELLVERSVGDLRADATIEDTVDQFDGAYEVMNAHPELQCAMDLEGNAKGFGVHAAGLVVSSQPITGVAAVLEREVPKGSGNIVQVVSMDKYDCERQGLEKLDYLALSTMDMIADALRSIGMPLEELYELTTDDPKVIDSFRQSDVTGVFQFDGKTQRIVNNMLKPDNFHELVCVNALSRPGPLHNGAVSGYIGAKNGTTPPDRLHPALDSITADTYYQIIFQEQILRIVTEIGQFDWTHAAYIRRIISKKLGNAEFNRQGAAFLKGASTVHERMDVPPMDETTAKAIWGSCITAGTYAFNAAHSTAYSKVSYWTMWLKVYHPAAFYAASLSKSDDSKMDALARDAVKHGIAILPPALHSDASWRVEDDKAVRAGWEQIPGIGAKMSQRIAEGPELDDWDDLAAVKGVGPKTVEKIREFVAAEDPFQIQQIEKAVTAITGDLEKGIEDQHGNKLPVPTHDGFHISMEKPKTKVVFLGQPVQRHIRDLFEQNRAKTGVELDPKTVSRPDMSQWLTIMLKDADGFMVWAVVSRFKYPSLKEMLWSFKLGSSDMLLIKAKKSATVGWEGGAMLSVDHLWVVEA